MTNKALVEESAKGWIGIVATASAPLLMAFQLDEVAALEFVPSSAVEAIYSEMESGNGFGAKGLFDQAVATVQAESAWFQRISDRDWVVQDPSGLSSRLQLAALEWNNLMSDKALVSHEFLFSDRADRDW